MEFFVFAVLSAVILGTSLEDRKKEPEARNIALYCENLGPIIEKDAGEDSKDYVLPEVLCVEMPRDEKEKD